MRTCATCKRYRPGIDGRGHCGSSASVVVRRTDTCHFHKLSDDFICPRCASELVDNIDRRECTNQDCDFFITHSALESTNPALRMLGTARSEPKSRGQRVQGVLRAPRSLPLVTHTIEHMPECPIRSTPLVEIPLNFGTVKKIAAAGCECFVTFEVKV